MAVTSVTYSSAAEEEDEEETLEMKISCVTGMRDLERGKWDGMRLTGRASDDSCTFPLHFHGNSVGEWRFSRTNPIRFSYFGGK